MLTAAARARKELEDVAGFWVRVIRDVGFPIAVAIFLLVGVVPKVDRMLAIMERLADSQERIVEQHNREIALLLELARQR